MKLFVIELCAIVLLIVLFAFACNLYRRFYTYFSKYTGSERQESDLGKDDKGKGGFAPPDKIIIADHSDSGNSAMTVIKNEPKAEIFNDSETYARNSYSNIPTQTYPKGSNPKIHTGSVSLFESPTKKF